MTQSDLLLITPPFSQPNTSYPATVFLKGFLKGQGFKVNQADLSIETILALFSEQGLKDMSKQLILNKKYLSQIDRTVKFLQGKDNSYAKAICEGILPKGDRYQASEMLLKFFKKDNIIGKAKFLATIFIEEIGDAIALNIDKNFGFSRYAEKIGISPASFELVEREIKKETFITQIMLKLLDEKIKQFNPKTVGFTIPFPGNLLSALKMANHIKKKYPHLIVAFGGGWVNTELRQLSESKLFDYVDYVCLDSGEISLLSLLKKLDEIGESSGLVKTFFRENGKVIFENTEGLPEIEPDKLCMPDYSDLPLDKYMSFAETVNPMHNLWSDGRWNKLMIAHGCYWHKCAFCDTSLDYICKYRPIPADILCDRMEDAVKQNNSTDFHFVDEAAPPKLLKELAQEIIKRNLKIRWWTNIRFESAFTEELCELLASSGCIAVSGGMEVLSERLLKKMNKGVSIEQAALTASNLSNAGIMVHAYLMYGFPTQTAQETIDSLEVTRQFFKLKLIRSAFWHRFALTVHSPIAKSPKDYGIEIGNYRLGTFGNNEIGFIDKTRCDHGKFGLGLRKALYNYMHNSCLDFPVNDWFDFNTPKPSIRPDLIEKILLKR